MNQVYVKTDAQGRVVDINSDAYLPDPAGWTQVDEGDGDRYRHAQANYLPGPLTDAQGRYRYKLDEGDVVERTAEELAAEVLPEIGPTDIEILKTRVDAGEDAILFLMDMNMGGAV